MKEASSSHTVVGMRPSFVNLGGVEDKDFMLGLHGALLQILRLKAPLVENVVVLCGDGVSLAKVSQAASKHGYNNIVFSQAPSDHEKKQLQAWLKGAGGLLVTSNLQFAGMEASTCVFITKNIVEETGARSGLLRATARLLVVSYAKEVDMKEV